MTDFVNHVNKCEVCGVVPDMFKNDRGWWQILCPDCGRSTTDPDSIRVIQSWNIYNPEPEKASV